MIGEEGKTEGEILEITEEELELLYGLVSVDFEEMTEELKEYWIELFTKIEENLENNEKNKSL